MRSASLKLRRGVLLSALLSACLVTSASPNVYGQAPAAAAKPAAAPYNSIALKEEFKFGTKGYKDLEAAKKEAMRGNFDIVPIRNFYRSYVMPQFTSLDDTLAINEQLATIRMDMEGALKLPPANSKAYNDELFKMLTTVAAGQYKPSAVINAMLLIGEMNENRAASNSPAKPYAPATKVLLTASEKGANDGVKAAALVGLERHVRALAGTWDDATRDNLATRLITWSKAPKPAAQSEEAHAYLTSRYLQILDLFKHSKSSEVMAFAVDTLANEFTHPMLREQALVIVGRHDPIETAAEKKLAAGRYTLRYMKKKLEDWSEIYDMSTSASGGGGMGDGGYGGGGGGYGSGYSDSGNTQAGYGGGGGGGYGGPKTEEKKEKVNPFETQDTQTVMLRRFMHELVQRVRFGLSGEVKGEVSAEFVKGILVGLPEGEERNYLTHALNTMQQLQVALNAETIQKKGDLNKEVMPLVSQLIAIAESYPGAVDKENERLIEEAPEMTAPAEPATEEVAEGTAPDDQPNPAVGVQPNMPAEAAPAPAQ